MPYKAKNGRIYSSKKAYLKSLRAIFANSKSTNKLKRKRKEKKKIIIKSRKLIKNKHKHKSMIKQIKIVKNVNNENINHYIDHYLNPEKYFYPKDYVLKSLKKDYPTPAGISILDVGYADYNDIKMWEHKNIHNIDNIEDYVYKIPPILVNRRGELIDDGNHRVNTLKKYKMNIPVIVLSDPPEGYNLRYMEDSGIFLISNKYPKDKILRARDIPDNRILEFK